MSNVIDFLERLGQDADLRYAAHPELDRAMQEAQMSPEIRAALINGDQCSLEKLLGASANVCCMIHVPLREDEEHSNENDSDKVKAA